MRYLTKRTIIDTENMKNGIWYEPIEKLSEYSDEKQNINDYRIPNMDQLLTISVCQEMCKILCMDGILGINVMSKSYVNASAFEDFVFNAIKTIFGDRRDGEMMNEWDVRLSQQSEATPDIYYLLHLLISMESIYIGWMLNIIM